MKANTQPKSMTRSINMTPRSGQDGCTVTGTDWNGPFSKSFGHDLEAAQKFISDFINNKHVR